MDRLFSTCVFNLLDVVVAHIFLFWKARANFVNELLYPELARLDQNDSIETVLVGGFDFFKGKRIKHGTYHTSNIKDKSFFS